jgi:iron-sulfur cluster assembly accessory protein
MTGWRLGSGGGPKPLIDAMRKLQSQSTSNPSSITQWAGIEALNGPQDFIPKNNEAFRFVDPKSFRFIDGTTLDYDTSLVSKGFIFNNPHAKSSCGCGTSFSV